MDKNDLQLNLTDFVGSSTDVQAKLAAKGLSLGTEQVDSLRQIFADNALVPNGGEVAGSTAICGPDSIAIICD
jgi:hypothetical protein